MEFDPGIHIVMHSVLSLKSGVTSMLELTLRRPSLEVCGFQKCIHLTLKDQIFLGT
jgi:hypothetical protein